MHHNKHPTTGAVAWQAGPGPRNTRIFMLDQYALTFPVHLLSVSPIRTYIALS